MRKLVAVGFSFFGRFQAVAWVGTLLLIARLIGNVSAAPPSDDLEKRIEDILKKDSPPSEKQVAVSLLGELPNINDAEEQKRFAAVDPYHFAPLLSHIAQQQTEDSSVRTAAVISLSRLMENVANDESKNYPLKLELDMVIAPLSSILVDKKNKRGVEERRAAAQALVFVGRGSVPYKTIEGRIEELDETELRVKVMSTRIFITSKTQISHEGNTVDFATFTKAIKELLNAGKVIEIRVFFKTVADQAEAVRIQSSATELPSASEDQTERFVMVARAAVPIMVTALNDSDPKVRRLAAYAFVQLGKGVANEITKGIDTKTTRFRPGVRGSLVAKLKPLFETLHKEASMLASAINDKDGGDDSDQKPSGQPVRMSARQALEVLAAARWRLYYEEGPPPGRKDVPDEREEESRRAPPNRQDKANDDPVFGDISVIQEALMKGLADPNVEARIAAIIALENLRDAAVRATPGLVKELGNSDVFVRWSAARALGKIEESRRRAKVPRAAAAKGAVDGLIRLLSDTDLDVQLAAAVALEPWGGDAAKAAGPLATAAATGDPSFRLAAIHALGEIGEPGHTKNAAAQLAKAVAFPEDDRVRAEAARLLGQFGPAAQDSIGALRAALKDPDASVRRAASDALLSITAPRPK